MKKFIAIAIIAIGFTSCSKEKMDTKVESDSEFKVTVYAVPVNTDGLEGKRSNVAMVDIKN